MLGNRSEDPRALETIAKHGTDSRYYVMIRGWLVQVKSGVESQLAATKDPGLKAKHQQRVTFQTLTPNRLLREVDLIGARAEPQRRGDCWDFRVADPFLPSHPALGGGSKS